MLEIIFKCHTCGRVQKIKKDGNFCFDLTDNIFRDDNRAYGFFRIPCEWCRAYNRIDVGLKQNKKEGGLENEKSK